MPRYPLRATASRRAASSSTPSSLQLLRPQRRAADDAAAELALLGSDWAIKPDPALAGTTATAPESSLIQTADMLGTLPPPPSPPPTHAVRVCLAVSNFNGSEHVFLHAFSTLDVADATTTTPAPHNIAYSAGLQRAWAEQTPIINGLHSHIATCSARLDRDSALLASATTSLAAAAPNLERMTAERDTARAECARLRQELASAEQLAATMSALVDSGAPVKHKKKRNKKKNNNDKQAATAGTVPHPQAMPGRGANNASDAPHTATALAAPASALPARVSHPATAQASSVAPPPASNGTHVVPARVPPPAAAARRAADRCAPSGWDLRVAADRARRSAREAIACVAAARRLRGYRPNPRARADACATQGASDDGSNNPWQNVEKKKKQKRRGRRNNNKEPPARRSTLGQAQPQPTIAPGPPVVPAVGAPHSGATSIRHLPAAPPPATTLPPPPPPAASRPSPSFHGGAQPFAPPASAAPAAPSYSAPYATPAAYAPPRHVDAFVRAMCASGMEPFFHNMLNNFDAQMAHFSMQVAAAAHGLRTPPSFPPPPTPHAVATAAPAPPPAINGV